MNLLIIEPVDVPLFITQVAIREEIRPVPGLGKNAGKFILQANLAAAGPLYAAEVAKAHYTTKTKPGDDFPVTTPQPTPAP